MHGGKGATGASERIQCKRLDIGWSGSRLVDVMDDETRDDWEAEAVSQQCGSDKRDNS